MNIEIHLIQNFAPSCLNRDDTNTPKSCLFGGVRRARISSQCLKRTIRLYMRDVHGVPTGTRTRRLAHEIATQLQTRSEEEAQRRALAALAAVGFSGDNDEQLRTKVGLYLSAEEISALAQAVDADWDALTPADAPAEGEGAAPKGGRGKKAKATGTAPPSVLKAVEAIQGKVSAADIALFGRMIAERTNMEVDAACQVAHALSTHEVEPEMDYFTAVDDLQPEAEPGAGMLGITEYNSACFYRYALINRNQLIKNLNGDAVLADRAIKAFVEASIHAVPKARQNSSAAQNPPDYIQVVVDAPAPRSLANAFVTPVRLGRDKGLGLTGVSISELIRYEKDLERMYGPPAGRRQVASTQDGVGTCTLPELLRWLEQSLGGA